MTDASLNLAFAGGGTGGHLFPGLAVAEHAMATGAARSVVFFGAERGIEARLVPAAGYELIAHPLTGIRGGSPRAAISAIWRLARAALRTRSELRRREVDVLIGLGGYASAAGVVGAWLARVPVVLLEQNRDPGLSNRTLARIARAVCTSFAETARAFPTGRAHYTGNPVRPAVERERRDGKDDGRDTLLVFGGSAGAVTLNRAVTRAVAGLAGRMTLPRIVHQTGVRGLEEVRAAYDETTRAHPGLELDVEVVPFIEDMASAYDRALLAVCRSGATSIAELIATATPSVLLPYPHAAGDHQTINAEGVAAGGAAVVVRDDEQAAERLTEVLGELLRDKEKLDSMAAAVATLRRPGAAARVLGVVRAVVAQTGKPTAA